MVKVAGILPHDQTPLHLDSLATLQGLRDVHSHRDNSHVAKTMANKTIYLKTSLSLSLREGKSRAGCSIRKGFDATSHHLIANGITVNVLLKSTTA